MSSYHKSIIIQQFNCAAATYEKAALLQKEIGNRLLERLDYINLDPLSILDLGCGTGYCSLQLKQKFPKAHIVSIDISERMIEHFKKRLTLINQTNKLTLSDISILVADAECLPFADLSFDLIFSNFALEWMADLQIALSELKRVLKMNGLLMFSTYGLDSLAELRNGIESIEQKKQQNDQSKQNEEIFKLPYFRDMHNIGDVMLRLQFQNPVMDVEWLSMTYKHVDAIVKDLCDTGIYSRSYLNPYLEHLSIDYEKYRQKNTEDHNSNNDLSLVGKLPVTYEIIYGHAWRHVQDDEYSTCAVSHEDVYRISVQAGFPVDSRHR